MPASKEPNPSDSVMARLIDNPVLNDFNTRWPDMLAGDPRNMTTAFDEIGKRLGKSKRSAVVRVTLAAAGQSDTWFFAMKSGRCKISHDTQRKADLELITTAEVWVEIASGRISPLEAFGRGKLRFRGDVELARMIVRRVREI